MQGVRREARAPTRSTRTSSRAGAYVLERAVLDLIPPDRNVSIEREVWPRLVGEGLFGFAAEAYWLDIGTPERYLQGTFDILEGNVQTAVADRLGRRLPGGRRPRRVARARSCRRRSSSAAARSPRARTSARSSCWRGRHGRRGRDDRALGRPERRRDRRRAACCATASSPPGARIGEGTASSGGAVLGEGVTVGARNVLTTACESSRGRRSPTERSRSEDARGQRGT